MSEEKAPTLAQQLEAHKDTLQSAVADALVEFEENTGLKVVALDINRHPYQEAYYSVVAKVDV